MTLVEYRRNVVVKYVDCGAGDHTGRVKGWSNYGGGGGLVVVMVKWQ